MLLSNHGDICRGLPSVEPQDGPRAIAARIASAAARHDLLAAERRQLRTVAEPGC
jgi:hypothetical protein